MERTKAGEFTWVDLSARDFEGQSAFYEGLLGWTHADTPFEGGVYRMFKADGHTVAGMSQLTPEMMDQGQPTAWNIYVATDDPDATVAKAVDLGGTVAVPPMDVPGYGRMAAIQDPTGAYLFLWKPVRQDDTMEYGPPGTLAWVDLGTRDPQRAIDFYAKLFGWDIQAVDAGPMPYWQIMVDGQAEGGIMPMPDMVPPEVPPYWMPYFAVSDIAAATAKARELGGSIILEPMEVAGGMVSFAVLADPAGATFSLMQMLQPMGT